MFRIRAVLQLTDSIRQLEIITAFVGEHGILSEISNLSIFACGCINWKANQWRRC